jgi:hypothetical protein
MATIPAGIAVLAGVWLTDVGPSGTTKPAQKDNAGKKHSTNPPGEISGGFLF